MTIPKKMHCMYIYIYKWPLIYHWYCTILYYDNVQLDQILIIWFHDVWCPGYFARLDGIKEPALWWVNTLTACANDTPTISNVKQTIHVVFHWWHIQTYLGYKKINMIFDTPKKLLQSEQLTIQPYRLGHGSVEAVSSLDFSLWGIEL